MSRRVAIVLTLVASLVLTLVADAGARRLHPQPQIHKASSRAPVIRKVSPLKANVGEKLTILGKNFRKGKSKTRIFFLRQGGGVTSTTPDYATKSRLVVTIPETLTPLLRDTGKNATPTRFQIRLLTSRYGTATKKGKSPLIGPASVDSPGGGGNGGGGPGEGDCDGDGIKNKNETDDDRDLISDVTEAGKTHTDPCKADTDGDGISDGYEWQSAKDMNDTTPFNTPDAALPYPGKKPWPNPLDPSDKGIDHDGDGLSMADEFQLFKFYGGNTLPLSYSDGLQVSQNVLAPTAPLRAYMDMNNDGVLSDDERDADSDGLGNWDEAYGRMTAKWWDLVYDGQNGAPNEKHYPNVMTGGPLEWIETSLTDPDTDGDGVNDGADDQDHDGLSNAFEINRPAFWDWTYVSVGPVNAHDGVLTPEEQDVIDTYNAFAPYPVFAPNPWARVQPYNPCKPVWSKTCHLHWPDGYYGDDEDWMGPDPRALNPPPIAPWLYTGES
jgi:hypothetical protein